jgi:dephospho-CoA kinase
MRNQARTEIDATTSAEGSRQTPSISVSERRTDELVIALVGAIGSGVTTTAKLLAELMERDYGYSAHYVKVSDIIRQVGHEIGEPIPAPESSPDERTSRLQVLGNVLRDKYTNRYLADKCIEKIAIDRISPPIGIAMGYQKVKRETGEENHIPVNRRRVHIIDSIKHTAEVDALREVYAETFWLLGVFCPEEVRENRLTNLGHEPANLKRIFQDDEEDGLANGQKVRDTVHQADFFCSK